MELHKISDGFVELKDDGTFKKHRVKFSEQNGHVMRIDTGEDGKETPSFVPKKRLLTVDDLGNILQQQTGFVCDHEVLGCPAHPEDDKGYVYVLESDFPSDYEDFEYKYDLKKEVFEKGNPIEKILNVEK